MASIFRRDISDDPKFTLLRSMSTFLDVSDDELRTFATAAYFTTREEGTTLIEEGRFASETFVILSGAVEVVRGDEFLALLGAGDVLGEIGAVLHVARTATVTAVTDVQVAVWDVQTFSALLTDLPALRLVVEVMASKRQESNAG
jgi:CRP-like cAMP-binding protein